MAQKTISITTKRRDIFPLRPEQKYSNEIAVILNQNIKISYKKLNSDVVFLASNLKRNTLSLIPVSNNYYTLVFYLACLRAKSVPMLIEKNTKIEKLINIINKFKPKYIFMKELTNCLPFDNYKKKELKEFDYIYENKKLLSYEIDKKIFLLLSTSGSTGSAKFVKLSKRNIFSNTENIKEYLNLNKKDCTLTNLPINYAYGLSVLNSHLLAGAKVILTDKSIVEKSTIDLAKRNPISNFNGVPSTFELLFNFKLESFYLKKARFISQAGGALSEKTFNNILRYTKSKKKFFIMYGQTEASPRMSYYLVKDKVFKSGIIGKPIKQGKFLLKDENNNLIKNHSKRGKIFYVGPNVFLGYANNKNNLKPEKKIKRLDTGDIGKFDKEGNYFIVGRESRYIKVNDKRISLDELEELLRTKLSEVVCSYEDKKIIIWYNKKNQNENKLLNIIKLNSSLPARLFIFKYIKFFPKNSSGKVLFKELSLKNDYG